MVRTHQGAVRAFLRRLTGEAAMADDLAQDTFMRAMDQVDGLRDAKATKAWLFTIAYRVFINNYRKTARQKALMDARGTAPDERLSAPAGLGLDISKAMQSLPDDCRACLMLVLSDGMSHSEAAHVTGLPLGTVKSHIARGKTKLQSLLGAYKESQKESNHVR